MTKKHFLPYLALLVLLCQCAGNHRSVKSIPNGQSATSSKELIDAALQAGNASERAFHTGTRLQAKNEAEKGLAFSTRCIERYPEEAGCYYYHAVNTGLFYQARVIGYQDGIKNMISDLDRVIQLNPSYESAGAYRILGQIYTELPQTTLYPDGITRDLEKAEKYLQEAINLAPDYPENLLSYADTLLKLNKTEQAHAQILKAKEKIPLWKRNSDYMRWIDQTKELEEKIASKR